MAFKLPKRFDSTIADSGIWIDVEDDIGQAYGSFRCALIDKHTQRWKLTLARMEKEQALRIKRNNLLRAKGQTVEADLDNFAATLFVELSLQDWKGVLDEEGNEVPFTKEAAKEFFALEDVSFVLEKLYDQASAISNYQPDEPDALETVEAVDQKMAEIAIDAEVDAKPAKNGK